MPIADRPVSGASIESVWGQQVHDYTFAPSGGRCHGSGVTVAQNTYVTLPIDVADDDPGGYVDTAANQFEVPTGGEGLYLVVVRIDETGGVTGDSLRGLLYVNGVEQTSQVTDMETGITNTIGITTLLPLVAGDVVFCRAVKRGATGASPTVGISDFILLRLGAEFGA